MTVTETWLRLRPLLAAECAAEAPAAGVDPDDLEQAVWLRLLALRQPPEEFPPADPAAWLRAAVRTEVRTARRRAAREVPWEVAPDGGEPLSGPEVDGEAALLAAERRETLRRAVRRLPGRCPALLLALLSHRDLTYPEIAAELGMSQGSVGPLRSRCLAHLRRTLASGIAAPWSWGKEP